MGKWIDTPDQRQNREFVTAWHYLLNEAERILIQEQDDQRKKEINMTLLQMFYVTAYDETTDFYKKFLYWIKKYI